MPRRYHLSRSVQTQSSPCGSRGAASSPHVACTPSTRSKPTTRRRSPTAGASRCACSRRVSTRRRRICQAWASPHLTAASTSTLPAPSSTSATWRFWLRCARVDSASGAGWPCCTPATRARRGGTSTSGPTRPTTWASIQRSSMSTCVSVRRAGARPQDLRPHLPRASATTAPLTTPSP